MGERERGLTNRFGLLCLKQGSRYWGDVHISMEQVPEISMVPVRTMQSQAPNVCNYSESSVSLASSILCPLSLSLSPQIQDHPPNLTFYICHNPNRKL